jgi:hypothetical protein
LAGFAVDDWRNSDDVISFLKWSDISAQTILYRGLNDGEIGVFDINDFNFGIKIYSKYVLDNDYVSFHFREFDCLLQNLNDPMYPHNCNWYPSYMIGYLTFLAKQFESLGFKGRIIISRIDNCLCRYIDSKEMPAELKPRSKGAIGVYQTLLEMGGVYYNAAKHSDRWADLNHITYDHGISIEFSQLIESVNARSKKATDLLNLK